MSLQEKQQVSISEVSIREFQRGDEICFRRLNEEWIERYFRVEPTEAMVLSDPEGGILDSGGKILFAVADDRCVGCCALRRMSDSEFEVAKMAVTAAFQGCGIGRKLLHAVIEAGRAHGCPKTLFGNQPYS